jgi:dual specificity tyrosine-phosphorylation-regulated kinase 2/3/4
MIIGKPIFPGADEHEQLDMLMEVLGPVPEPLKARCSRWKVFFYDRRRLRRPERIEAPPARQPHS